MLRTIVGPVQAARLGLAIAGARVRGWARLTPKPRSVIHLLTKRCPLSCSYCYAKSESLVDEMDTDEILEVYRQLPGLLMVRITGGEPMLRDDLAEICEFIQHHTRPFFIHISTNGFFWHKTEKLLRRTTRGRMLFSVSLDGDEHDHDRQRGVAGSYARALNTVERLAAHRTHQDVGVEVNVTVTRQTLPGVNKLVHHLNEIKVPVNYILARSFDAGVMPKNLKGSTDLVWPPLLYESERESAAHLLGEAIRSAHRGRDFFVGWSRRYDYRGLENRLLKGWASPNPRCSALHEHIRIHPNGDLLVCRTNSDVVGNIRAGNFAEVWHSDQAAHHRLRVRECAGCWLSCDTLPNALFSGDLVRFVLREGLVGLIRQNEGERAGREH